MAVGRSLRLRASAWLLAVTLIPSIAASDSCPRRKCVGYDRSVVRNRTKGACYRIMVELDGQPLTHRPITGCHFKVSLDSREDERLSIRITTTSESDDYGWLVIASSQCRMCGSTKYRRRYRNIGTTIGSASVDPCDWYDLEVVDISWAHDGRVRRYPNWCSPSPVNGTCRQKDFEDNPLAGGSLCKWHSTLYDLHMKPEKLQPIRHEYIYRTAGAVSSFLLITTFLGVYEQLWKSKYDRQETGTGTGFGDSVSSMISAHTLRFERSPKKADAVFVRTSKKGEAVSARTPKKGDVNKSKSLKRRPNDDEDTVMA